MTILSKRASRPAIGPLPHALMTLGLVAGCSGTPAAGPATTASAAAGPPKTYGLTIDHGGVGKPPANGKTLLAIYMVGSNLEDDVHPRNNKSDEEDAGGRVTTGSGSN